MEFNMEIDQIINLFKAAFIKMKEASYQSHSGHWDPEGTGGENCPECIDAREKREAANKLFDQAKEAYNKSLNLT